MDKSGFVRKMLGVVRVMGAWMDVVGNLGVVRVMGAWFVGKMLGVVRV